MQSRMLMVLRVQSLGLFDTAARVEGLLQSMLENQRMYSWPLSWSFVPASTHSPASHLRDIESAENQQPRTGTAAAGCLTTLSQFKLCLLYACGLKR